MTYHVLYVLYIQYVLDKNKCRVGSARSQIENGIKLTVIKLTIVDYRIEYDYKETHQANLEKNLD